MPPKYLPSNDGNIIDEIPRTIPPAYGSAQDTRAGDITQLHELPQVAQSESATEYNDRITTILPSSLFTDDKPINDVFQYTVAVSADSVVSLPFKAKSIRVDNLTNQWVFIPGLRVFVPPDWYGAIFTANGLQQINVIFMPPSGLVNPAATPNTIVSIVAHFERLPDVAGVSRL